MMTKAQVADVISKLRHDYFTPVEVFFSNVLEEPDSIKLFIQIDGGCSNHRIVKLNKLTPWRLIKHIHDLIVRATSKLLDMNTNYNDELIPYSVFTYDRRQMINKINRSARDN